jgi:hypothetical protein
MRRALPLITAVTLALASPAAASDLLYPGGTVLSDEAAGKPVWMLQAHCAGLYGATSNVLDERGDAAGAAAAKAQGVAFLKAAIDRLMKDRGLSRAAALETASLASDAGRQSGLQNIRSGGGFGSRSQWNTARSLCLDVADVYAGIPTR